MKRIIRIQLLWQKLQTVQAYLDSFSADDGSREQELNSMRMMN